MKLCGWCNINKSITDFHNRNVGKDGKSDVCKDCINRKNRERSMTDEGIIKRRAKYNKIKNTTDHINKAKLYSRNHYNSLEGRAKSLLKTTIRRSTKFSTVENPVDLDFIINKLKVGKCEVTGTTFCFDNNFNTCKNPLSPSIDRVDSNIGYAKDNVRLVIWQYNLMKGELTDSEVFDIFGEYFKDKLKNGE